VFSLLERGSRLYEPIKPIRRSKANVFACKPALPDPLGPLNPRKPPDGEQGDVGGHRAEVVEQQTHAHAAVCRAEQMFEKNLARQVLVPDEILHIEAALRRICQGQPRGQRVAPVRERVEAGLARMRGDA
jgi:hypothetical protein